LDLFVCWNKNLFGRKFCGMLREMYILRLLGRIFHRFLLRLFHLWSYLILKFVYFWNRWLMSWWQWVLKSTTNIVLEFICAFFSVFVYLFSWNWVCQYFVHICFQLLYPLDEFSLITMKGPSLSLLTNFGLKFDLPDMSTTTTACV
jgi:hypothetical protein